MSKLKEKSGIKILAADAKARLVGGYHNKKGREENIKSYREIVLKSFTDKNGIQQDKKFYDKVIQILKEGNVANPLQRLADPGYMDTLSYSARQRYLLEIAEKYNKIKSEMQEHGI